MEEKIINFHCPEFNFGINFYQKLIELEACHPEYFNEGVKIATIFGCFPNMIWNGGGTSFGSYVSIDEMESIRDFYYNLGIPLQLTFTNPLLQKEDCYDRYCNKVAEIFQNDKNMILVSSPILEEYLRKKYPKYKYCKSIIASEFDYNYEEVLNDYEYIVLPRRKVKDFQFLQSINIENRPKFEILCNDPCPIDCPRLYSHYEDFAKVTLYEEKMSNKCDCSIFTDNNELKFLTFREDQISFNEIKSNYLNHNYNSFKLAGRAGNMFIFSIISYFIKQEYQIEILKLFLV